MCYTIGERKNRSLSCQNLHEKYRITRISMRKGAGTSWISTRSQEATCVGFPARMEGHIVVGGGLYMQRKLRGWIRFPGVWAGRNRGTSSVLTTWACRTTLTGRPIFLQKKLTKIIFFLINTPRQYRMNPSSAIISHN